MDTLIDREFRSPLADSVFFETSFDRTRLPFLDDHRVYGDVVVSGAALIALLLHAAARLDGGPSAAIEDGGQSAAIEDGGQSAAIEDGGQSAAIEDGGQSAAIEDGGQSAAIEDLVFHRALMIPEGGRRLVQLAIAAAPGRRAFKLISLDPADGPDRGAGAPDLGTLHATGFLSVPSGEGVTTDPTAPWNRLETEIPATSVYDLQRRRHIDLGPSYRWLDRLRVGDGKGVGQLVAPAIPGGLAGYRLHPGLIDSCFAVLVMAGAPDMDDDATLVPAGVRQFRFVRSPSGSRLWAHAQVQSRSASHLTGDVRLYDETGALLAEMIGLEGRRTQRELFLPDAPARMTADWLYAIDWRRAPLSGPGTAGHLVAPHDLAPGLRAAFERRVASPETTAYAHAMRTVDELCVAYVRRALADLGLDWRTGDRVTADAAAAGAGVIDRHARLWRRLLGMLEDAGDLRRDGTAWTVIAAPPAADPERAARELGARGAGVEIELALLERCGGALARVLRGECDALNELLFPRGDLTGAAAIYRDTHAARLMNEVIADAVTAALARVPARRSVRVLEIGAGTGGCTTAVLPALAALPAASTYVFTDVSSRFTTAARDTFAAYPFVRYERLDVERDPEGQGFAPHTFDVVIAANVLHATVDLPRALAHVRRLLAPGGLLLLMEGTAPARWLDLTFGLTEGWWRFADARSDHPLLSTERWDAALRAHGFDQTLAVTTPPGQRHAVSQQAVIVARADQAPEAATTDARWLVFADDDRGAALAATPGAALAAALGGASIVVSAGAACRRLSAHAWSVDPGTPAHFVEMLDALTGAGAPPLRGVVYAWGGWPGALHLAQALARRRFAEPPRVWLVTRGAVSVAGEPLPGLAHAPLWGLGATLAVEHPELAPTLVDLDAGDDGVSALADEIAAASPEPRVALRASGRHVARLTRARVTGGAELRLRADRTYLIAGGLGDLGAAVARRLAERGARRLALVGRREPSPFARDQIRAIEAAGGDVRVLLADVTDATQMAAAIAAVDRDMPPLAGVIHAAGTLDNARLIDLDAARFTRVLAPKVEGAAHLHRLTAGHALDFFVVFSSAASLLGAHGQANHAAANAFLDALAHHRRARGLPGLSVNWGAWSQIGAAARSGTGMLRVKGVGTITPTHGLDVLEQLLHADRAQIAVVPIDWPELLAQTGRTPLLSELDAAAPGAAPAAAILGELAATPGPARRARLHAYVASQVGAVLALPPSASIHPRQGFFDMGMDSLTSVELRNRLQTGLGCPLPPTIALDCPTVDALVDYLAPAVLASVSRDTAEAGSDDRETPSAAREPSGWTPARASASIPASTDDLARLTEAEAEALLLKELAKLHL